ncbi:low-density lipoprotein receptor-like [Frankliniella occidentalis]|uniref:Low-density lipoprotein receptor-like n=1 Tax=Frankliniella occidentalis TaxID=133901 RepID=A0A6J1TD17_FRAOC|nr:low-density lipoprotein receptor-like [Frankliniella occidentalis]
MTVALFLGLTALLTTSTAWQTCPSEEFRCDISRCILRRFVCDAWIHCKDGSDEANCTPQTCAPGAFWCDNGCRAKEERCNGRVWCKDGVDEMNCPARSSNQTYTCPGSDGRYYEPTVVCDVDCNCDGCEDEKNCNRPEACSRSAGAFFCDGECRNRDRRCDRVADCSDGRDEMNCPYNKKKTT